MGYRETNLIIYTIGTLIEVVVGLYAIVLSFLAAKAMYGWWGFGFNCVLFPITGWLAPFDSWFKEGNFIPVIILYGGMFIGVGMQNTAKRRDFPKHPLDD